MSARARDPRTARTVASLDAALRGFLAHEPLDSVSVSELCRQADVRRTTFYTHFASVAELLAQMLTAEVDDLLSVPDLTGVSVATAANEFQATLVAAYEAVARDRLLFRVAFEADASVLLRKSLSSMLASRVETALAIWHEHQVALDVEPWVAVPFAAGGLAASFEAWAMSDDEDAERWAEATRDQMPPWWPRPS